MHAQGKPTPLKFTLDLRVTSQTAPFFLAESKGYYREEGLDVTIDVGSGSVASITRVASGAYDLGLGDISALAEFHAQNADASVQAIYQYYIWANIDRVVYGIDAVRLRAFRGERLDQRDAELSCRDVFAASAHAIECIGPALIEASSASHQGAWKA
ncbi:ABC transporter substrate-binding protein [Acidovorax sp. SUPP3334]|uniref:ABC transporter substrate-binding protein n=1 Tax=Acidovorax sp. SUPP3334 TaxID=2920881 RepID=UPI0023DE59A3|nr:ABC transporter substrate-binding protein [Acidovorax sp. SUPP3334]GKT22139.1 hypothetical protein AVHM3334_07310 [Acidovorax sp. SUPP3334]